MPIYEYQCKQCDKVFEYMQRMSDDPKTECEECAGQLDRLISRSAFHLKGGGWYKDLYSSTKPADTSKASSDSGGSSSADSSSSSSASSDSGSSSSDSSSSSSDSGSSSSTASTTSSSSKSSD